LQRLTKGRVTTPRDQLEMFEKVKNFTRSKMKLEQELRDQVDQLHTQNIPRPASSSLAARAHLASGHHAAATMLSLVHKVSYFDLSLFLSLSLSLILTSLSLSLSLSLHSSDPKPLTTTTTTTTSSSSSSSSSSSFSRTTNTFSSSTGAVTSSNSNPPSSRWFYSAPWQPRRVPPASESRHGSGVRGAYTCRQSVAAR
jgi:hypothetical protein